MKAEKDIDEKITIKKAVVTVPAYFNKAQKQATSDACKIAGIDCLRVISEPTAASLTYAMKLEDLTSENHYVVVYDLGGGTLDISVLNITDHIIEVMASNGDTQLGGRDFDEELVTFFKGKIEENLGISMTELDEKTL